MGSAVRGLGEAPDFVLIDGNRSAPHARRPRVATLLRCPLRLVFRFVPG
jgi:hypothetical protein